MIVQEARFATALPGRLILKLCKHFRHKVPAEFDELHGRVEFQPGLCFLTAEAGALHIRIEGADDGQISRMLYILEDHIRRMQRLETLQLGWQVAG